MSENTEGSGALSLEALATEVAALRADNSRLAAEVAELRTSIPAGVAEADVTDPAPRLLTRRGAMRSLTAAAVGGAGVALGSSILQATPAAAANGNPVTVGGAFTGSATTQITTTTGYGFAGFASAADGVHGETTANGQSGVAGIDNSPTGGYGVYGRSAKGPGTNGISTDGPGVAGSSVNQPGVSGTSTNQAGVYGAAEHVGVQGRASGASTAMVAVAGVLGEGTGVGAYGVVGHSVAGPALGAFSAADNTGPTVRVTADGNTGALMEAEHHGTGAGLVARTPANSAVIAVAGGSKPALVSQATGTSHGVMGLAGASAVAFTGPQTGVVGVGAGALRGVLGTSDSGEGVRGQSTTGTGVIGTSPVEGVHGETTDGVAIRGVATGTGHGVAGLAGTSTGAEPGVHSQCGVLGIGAAGLRGVLALSDSGEGVHGQSNKGSGVVGVAKGTTSGYGGQFQGGRAQLYLVPATTTGHPTTGTHSIGELFLDKTGALYLCTGAGSSGGTWKKITVS